MKIIVIFARDEGEAIRKMRTADQERITTIFLIRLHEAIEYYYGKNKSGVGRTQEFIRKHVFVTVRNDRLGRSN